MTVNPITRSLQKFSSAITRSTAGESREHVDRYLDDSTDSGAQRIDKCQPGAQVQLVGTVKAVSSRSDDQSPALEIELADSSGVITVVWLGRQRIPGIVQGRSMKVCGRMTCNTDRPTIFNPRYELLPLQ